MRFKGPKANGRTQVATSQSANKAPKNHGHQDPRTGRNLEAKKVFGQAWPGIEIMELPLKQSFTKKQN